MPVLLLVHVQALVPALALAQVPVLLVLALMLAIKPVLVRPGPVLVLVQCPSPTSPLSSSPLPLSPFNRPSIGRFPSFFDDF